MAENVTPEVKKLRERVAAKSKGARYLGNAGRKMEFHRIKKLTPQCQVEEIKEPVYFLRGRSAIEAGFDPCSFCSVYWRSKN